MGNNQNIANLKRGYKAFAEGDMATLTELFAEDIVWHVGGNNMLTGDYKGRDEVFAFFMRLAQETGGTMKLELHDVLANDEHGVALVHARLERNGKRYEGNEAHVFHNRDGKVTEFWAFAEDPFTLEELFAE